MEETFSAEPAVFSFLMHFTNCTAASFCLLQPHGEAGRSPGSSPLQKTAAKICVLGPAPCLVLRHVANAATFVVL